MLGDERVVVDEALVKAGEMSVGDNVGEDDSGVIIADEADAGVAALNKSEDILIALLMKKGLEVDVPLVLLRGCMMVRMLKKE